MAMPFINHYSHYRIASPFYRATDMHSVVYAVMRCLSVSHTHTRVFVETTEHHRRLRFSVIADFVRLTILLLFFFHPR